MKGKIQCDLCGCDIHRESIQYDQDDCYEIEGVILCEDCVMKYVKENFFKKLEMEGKEICLMKG